MKAVLAIFRNNGAAVTEQSACLIKTMPPIFNCITRFESSYP